MKKPKHKHSWAYEQAVFGGRGNSVYVHRYCFCGVRQWGTTTRWRKMSKADAKIRDAEAAKNGR